MLKTTGKYSVKPYQCRNCKTKKDMGTNHWGSCYPRCSVCGESIWDCLEKMPKGYKKPQEWKTVKLEDICSIKNIKASVREGLI